MGYWEEKQEYSKELEERHNRTNFCNVCGRKLTSKNIKGKCINCKEIVCNSCGKIHKGKVTCIDCKEELKENKNEDYKFSSEPYPSSDKPPFEYIQDFTKEIKREGKLPMISLICLIFSFLGTILIYMINSNNPLVVILLIIFVISLISFIFNLIRI